MPTDKSAYLKIIFHFSKKNICCASVGTQKKCLNESVLLKHNTHTLYSNCSENAQIFCLSGSLIVRRVGGGGIRYGSISLTLISRSDQYFELSHFDQNKNFPCNF